MTAFNTNNLHYGFYVEYYKDIEKEIQKIDFPKDRNKISFKGRNQSLLNKINHVSHEMKSKSDRILLDDLDASLTTLDFKILYPGVLIGIGLNHGFGGKGEIELGFTLDYVTGIPYLPGSSVKGTIRDAFLHKAYIQEIFEDYLNIKISEEEIKQLELAVFEGAAEEVLPVSQRTIFYDAVLKADTKKGEKAGNMIGIDIITPHRKDQELLELAEPSPTSFLKILPGNYLHFAFKFEELILPSSLILDKEDMKKLFQIILEDVGVGGKTNVGYGALERI